MHVRKNNGEKLTKSIAKWKKAHHRDFFKPKIEKFEKKNSQIHMHACAKFFAGKKWYKGRALLEK